MNRRSPALANVSRLLAAASLAMLALGVLPAAGTSPALAQNSFQDFLGGAGNFGDPLGKPDVNPVTMQARFTPPAGGKPGQLTVEATIAPGSWIYSITQPPGGPMASKFVITPSSEYQVGPFQAVTPPKAAHDEIFNTNVEKHEGTAVWTAPVTFAPGINPANVEIRGALNAQVCTASNCLPSSDFGFVAQADQQSSAAYRAERTHTEISGQVWPAVVQPGGTVRLQVTATPDRLWHVYALAEPGRENKTAKPTVIVVDGQVTPWTKSAPTTDSPIVEKGGDYYHEGPVTWTVEMQVPKDAAPGAYVITGGIGYQSCKLGTCDTPQGATFDATIEVGNQTVEQAVPLSFRSAEYGSVEQKVLALETTASTTKTASSLWVMLASALLGGFILNFMPCVLPVIGIKILSVVEKAHHDRREIFWLNFWYVVGMLLVFFLLASLAVFANLGWGQHFQSTWFNIAMAALVWTMALSFLGVWEIPLPGFAGGQTANELQQKEGISGAISRGIFTTILATPCSGPFLGAVFGFTLKQPPWVTYAIFGCVGLGMALPYIVMGLFPKLVRWLPRPGAWMETFKQVMGFVLLGTVVYLFTFIGKDYFIQTFALLIALWAGCWWIGRTPLTASLRERAEAYAGGLIVVGLVAIVMFGNWFGAHQLPWEPFSVARLQQLQAEGKTVMIDFTADWCPTCKVNLATALNTKDVKEAVESGGVVTLLADWTKESPEIKQFLNQHDQNSIPFLVIYPAKDPHNPIRLPDMVTQGQVLEALEQAGPSLPASNTSPQVIGSQPSTPPGQRTTGLLPAGVSRDS